MYIIEELKECMKEVGEGTQYHGYFYSIGDVLTISVSGMMCGIEKAKYIWEWANEEPVRQFLSKEFGIEKMPCYAQYMNILGIVDAEKFNVLWDLSRKAHTQTSQISFAMALHLCLLRFSLVRYSKAYGFQPRQTIRSPIVINKRGGSTGLTGSVVCAFRVLKSSIFFRHAAFCWFPYLNDIAPFKGLYKIPQNTP